MAKKLLQQGKGVGWLCDEDTGAALVESVGSAGVSDSDLVTNYDTVSDVLAYVGKALPGTLTSAASWQIKKLVFDAVGDVTMTFADGNANFGSSWDNRASLTYS